MPFTDAQKGGTFLLEKNVRLVSEDVFVADRKVADLGQIVARLSQTDLESGASSITLISKNHHVGLQVGIAVAVFLAFVGLYSVSQLK